MKRTEEAQKVVERITELGRHVEVLNPNLLWESERVDEAEAEVNTLRTALEEIKENPTGIAMELRNIARSALSANPPATPDTTKEGK